MKLVFLGTGEISKAVILGLLKSKIKYSKIYISRRNKKNSTYLSSLNKKIIVLNENQKIIITDYKNFKKYQNKFLVINGYQYERDIIYFLKNIYNISDESLINYCLSLPYFTVSEATKYKVNKSGYITDAKSNALLLASVI